MAKKYKKTLARLYPISVAKFNFLMYNDWKTWSIKCKEHAGNSYYEYVKNYISTVNQYKNDKVRTLLVAFDYDKFLIYVKKNNINLDQLSNKEFVNARASWVNSVPEQQIISPYDIQYPNTDAFITKYEDIPSKTFYDVVVDIHKDNQSIFIQKFVLDDFESMEDFVDALLLFTAGFGVSKTFNVTDD